MSAPVSLESSQQPFVLPPDVRPSVELLVIEDDAPVDNIYAERQQRLLTSPLTVWHGKFEDAEDDWLRWCDANGIVLATGEERAAMAEQRAGQAEQRADQAIQCAERLANQLRNLGVEPGNGNG